MKKLIFLSFLVPFLAFSQERANESKKSFLTISEKLENAIGWCFSKSTGEWIENDNVIYSSNEFRNTSLEVSSMKSKVSQNFIYVQTKKVLKGNEILYAIFIKKYDGYFKYKEIKQDWQTTIQTRIYLFSEKEYKKLKNIKGEIILNTKHEIVLISGDDETDDNFVIRKIETTNPSFVNCVFKVKKADDGSIRFLLPGNETTMMYNYDFEKQYFETSLDNFKKIIIE